ncbi:MAG: hypothetical protein IJY49_06160 [Clostridia bacterium]|nr:hypothetical protein [Clostridia bacterium]
MLKRKFFKNLIQTISFFSALMIFELFLLIGYFASLGYEQNFGWILLIISLSLIVLFFLVGFYWIFQIVSIDERGIKIFFVNKTIEQVKWEEIKSIEEATIMKNPAIRIKTINGTEIHLDKRKNIIKAIETYSQKQIVKNPR